MPLASIERLVDRLRKGGELRRARTRRSYSAFCYAFAQRYQAIKFYRLDPPPDTSKDALPDCIETNLVVCLPSMFGFTVYSSISLAEDTGAIPFPTRGERVVGGHAMVAVGYDGKKIKNSSRGSEETTGAFRVRNSWVPGWGEDGYGWLPYEYELQGLAVDW